MSRLEVNLSAEPAAYSGGAPLEGEVVWHLEDATDSLDLKVYWTTDGEVGVGSAPVVVYARKIPVSTLEGREVFRIDLPQSPWSFQGKLFAVRWYVELSQEDPSSERTEFILGPGGKAVQAGAAAPT